MFEELQAVPRLVWGIVVVLILLSYAYVHRDQVAWRLHFAMYGVPYFGKLASLARDVNRYGPDISWFKSEIILCRDFKKFIHIETEDDFNEKKTYLRKSGDDGRKKMPWSFYIISIVLITIISLGYTYSISDGLAYAFPGSNQQTFGLLRFVVALMLVFILGFLTLQSGNQSFKNQKIKEARQKWNEGNRQGGTTSRSIALNEPQDLDDAEPEFRQLMNRVGDKPDYAYIYLTLCLVFLLGVLSFYMHYQMLEKKALIESMQANQIPPEIYAALGSIVRSSYWTSFSIVSLLCLGSLVVVWLAGRNYSFAGRNSEAAYQSIEGDRFSNFEDVRDDYQKIADAAQTMLGRLQQMMMESNSSVGREGLHSKKTFSDFMASERDIWNKELQSQKRYETLRTKHTQDEGVLSQLQALQNDETAIRCLLACLPTEQKKRLLSDLVARNIDKILIQQLQH